MSSKVKTYCLLILSVCGLVSATAQTFNEQGLMSGSGYVFLPAINVAPISQFRIQAGRLDLLRSGQRGVNVYTMQAGLSSNLEIYLKLTSEQAGMITSLNSFGIGGKLKIPFQPPLFDQAALWVESVSSPISNEQAYLPQNIFRGAILANTEIVGLKPIVLGGISKRVKVIKPLGGVGANFSINNSIKLGGEMMYNYAGQNDVQGLLSVTIRIISNIGLQISTGYTASPTLSSWLLSAGISIGTADIDFTQKLEKPPPVIVPSFEEMEDSTKKEIDKENKPEDEKKDDEPK